MSEPATRPTPAPGIPPADLAVRDWINPSMIEGGACPALADARTAGEAAKVVRKMLAGLPDGYYCPPAAFLAADGRFHVVEVTVNVRPATPDDVRHAAGSELEYLRDTEPDELDAAEGAGELAARAEWFAARTRVLEKYLRRAAE